MLLLWNDMSTNRYSHDIRNVHWDVNELDEVTNEAHDRKTDSNGLRDLEELYLSCSKPSLYEFIVLLYLCAMAWCTW